MNGVFEDCGQMSCVYAWGCEGFREIVFQWSCSECYGFHVMGDWSGRWIESGELRLRLRGCDWPTCGEVAAWLGFEAFYWHYWVHLPYLLVMPSTATGESHRGV